MDAKQYNHIFYRVASGQYRITGRDLSILVVDDGSYPLNGDRMLRQVFEAAEDTRDRMFAICAVDWNKFEADHPEMTP